MDPAQTVERVGAVLTGIEHAWLKPRDGSCALAVGLRDLRRVLEQLRERADFEQATFVTAVDRLGHEPRFELVHQLFSFAHQDRVRVHSPVGEGEAAPSCIDLWPGAAYMERECFDMFGLSFDGHAGLKRLYMPDEYEHHPLRKDFPHRGIEPDRLYREWDRRRRADWHPEQELERGRA